MNDIIMYGFTHNAHFMVIIKHAATFYNFYWNLLEQRIFIFYDVYVLYIL